jgi:hypothetical protein
MDNSEEGSGDQHSEDEGNNLVPETPSPAHTMKTTGGGKRPHQSSITSTSSTPATPTKRGRMDEPPAPPAISTPQSARRLHQTSVSSAMEEGRARSSNPDGLVANTKGLKKLR